MKIKELMTANPEVISPGATLCDAARKMKDLNIGCLPVCNGERLIGMVTDRDLVIRGIAEKRAADETPVEDVMTSPIVFCFEDQEAEEVARIMEVRKIRRLVVLDRQKKMVGVVSLDDLARTQALGGEVLSQVANSMGQKKVA